MRSKNNLWIIIAILALNSIGLSIVLPLLPFLVAKYLPPHQVVVGMSLLMSVFAACTFFAAPILGGLSDRYGRKIILIISLLGSVAGYVIFGIGGALWILFLGRIIDGLTAGNISTLFAIVSDSTEPEERTKWFGYIGSVMGLGKIGGPAIGGLLGSIALSLPFFVTAGLIFISGLLAYFRLPETRPADKRTPHLTAAGFNIFTHFKEVFGLRGLAMLFVSGTLFYAGQGIFQFNFTLFLKDVYKWGPAIIGSLLTIVGVCDIATRALLLPWLLKNFSEQRIGIAGLVGLAAGLALICTSAFVHSVLLISLAIVFIIAGGGLFESIYNGRLSRSVDESQQGKLQGVNQSLQSANNMLVPLGAAAIYFHSPAMLYAVATFIALFAMFTYSKYLPVKKAVMESGTLV